MNDKLCDLGLRLTRDTLGVGRKFLSEIIEKFTKLIDSEKNPKKLWTGKIAFDFSRER